VGVGGSGVGITRVDVGVGGSGACITRVGVGADGITVAVAVGGATSAVSVSEPPKHETVSNNITTSKAI